MTAADDDWRRSYAVQALSDLDAREALAESPGIAKCHRLHFLQMAAEKVCKAHLVAENGHDHVRKSHAYVAKVLPVLARQFYGVTGRAAMQRWQVQAVRHFASEIELLAPACDDGGSREDNTEYPWIDGGGAVRTPCLHSFPKLNDSDRTISMLIRLIRVAAQSYAG